MKFLRQSTASQVRTIGPFVDDTDGKTAETALTIANTDIKLMANGAASVNKNSGGGTHRINGMYSMTFNATDTATVGELTVSVVVAGALPVWEKFYVLEEAVFDALFVASAVGPLTSLGTNAPTNWINAAAIAASSMNGKGDWATAGAAMSLTTGERSTLAAAIESAMINEGDATALLEAIADKIAAENPSLGDLTTSAIASAVWANAARTLTANPGLDAGGIRAAIGQATANLDTKIAEILSAIGSVTGELLEIDAAELATVLAPLLSSGLSGTTLVVSNANLTASGSALEVNQGDHYADIPTRIDIESEADLTAYHLVIAARLQTATATKLGLRMAIQSDEDGQFAMFGPTSTQTEAWSAGTYELRYRIQYAANQYRTIGRGILTVLPFDTPEPLVDVDPAE